MSLDDLVVPALSGAPDRHAEHWPTARARRRKARQTKHAEARKRRRERRAATRGKPTTTTEGTP